MKKTLALCLMMAASVQVSAGRLDDAFDSLTGSGSFQDNGVFKSQIRTTAQLGSFSYRFPVNTTKIDFFNVQAPSLDVGCDGISGVLGGVSFISGDEIVQLIENIAQASKMYILQLALNLICEDCVAELRSVIDKVNKFSAMAKDACAMAEWAVTSAGEMFGADLSLDKNPTKKGCQQRLVNSGEEEQADRGFLCSTWDKLEEWEEKFRTENEDGSPKSATDQERAMAISTGNTTWAALRELNIIPDMGDISGDSYGHLDPSNEQKSRLVMGEFLQSIFGTSSNSVQPDSQNPSTGDPERTGGATRAGTPDMTVALDVFLCGTNFLGDIDNSVASSAPLAQEYCKNSFKDGSGDGVENMNILSCPERAPDKKDWRDCEKPETISFKVWANQDIVTKGFGEGFLFLIERNLRGAIEGAVTGTYPSGFDEKLFIGLAEIAPWPLYKAVNLAAVFPEVSDQLLAQQSNLLGLAMVSNFMGKIMREAGGGSSSNVDPKTIEKIQEKVVKLIAAIDQRAVLTNTLSQQAELITASINVLNNVMLEQLYSQSLLGNASFTRDVANQGAMVGGAFSN